MPRLAWHLEEPRVGQSYPNFYAAQLASKFGKVVLSGAGGDELFGGYPWRYYRAVVNDDFERLRRQVLRLLAAAGPRATSSSAARADLAATSTHVSTRDIFRDVFPDHARRARRARRTTSTTRSTSRRRPSCTACWSSRTSSRWRTASRRALPFLDNDLVDFAQRVPVGLKLGNLGEVVRLNENEPGPEDPALLPADPRRQAAPAPGDGAPRPGRGHRGARSRASPRPTRAGSAARASTTCAAGCRRRRARSTTSSTATSSAPGRRAPRGRREPPAADLVAALARAVVPHFLDGAGAQPSARAAPGRRRSRSSSGRPRSTGPEPGDRPAADTSDARSRDELDPGLGELLVLLVPARPAAAQVRVALDRPGHLDQQSSLAPTPASRLETSFASLQADPRGELAHVRLVEVGQRSLASSITSSTTGPSARSAGRAHRTGRSCGSASRASGRPDHHLPMSAFPLSPAPPAPSARPACRSEHLTRFTQVRPSSGTGRCPAARIRRRGRACRSSPATAGSSAGGSRRALASVALRLIATTSLGSPSTTVARQHPLQLEAALLVGPHGALVVGEYLEPDPVQAQLAKAWRSSCRPPRSRTPCPPLVRADPDLELGERCSGSISFSWQEPISRSSSFRRIPKIATSSRPRIESNQRRGRVRARA